jgi:hypothetical protein
MQYIIQQLRDIGFSEDEVESFLTLIYTNSSIPKDIESQIAYSNNSRYIWAFNMLDEDIYGMLGQYFTEYINSLSTEPIDESITIDSTIISIDNTTITIDHE